MAVGITCLLCSGIGHSEVRVCNGIDQALLIAVGVGQGDQIHAFGWHNLEPEACGTDLYEDLQAEGVLAQIDEVFVHARDKLRSPNLVVGGEQVLCIDKDFSEFWVQLADSTCAKRGYSETGFHRVDADPKLRGHLLVIEDGVVFRP